MAGHECSTWGSEPDWAGLRAWLNEYERVSRRKQEIGSSVLCIGCREWFIYPVGGLVVDADSGQPVYRCAGCEMARAAGFASWGEFRMATSRAAMRRDAERRGELR